MEEELTEDRAPPLMKEDSKTTVERVIDECSGPVFELLLKHEDRPSPKTAPVSKLKKEPIEIEEQVIDEFEALDGLAELFNPTAHDAHESKATLHTQPAEYELRIFHEDLPFSKTAPVSKLKKDPTEIEEQVIDEWEALDGLAQLFNPTVHDTHEIKATLHTCPAEHELRIFHEDLPFPKTAPVSKLKKDPTEIEEQVIDEWEALDGLAQLFNPTGHDAHESKATLHTCPAHELMSWKTCIEALEEYFKMSEWLWGEYVDTNDDDTEYETADETKETEEEEEETDNYREDEVDSEPDSEMDTEVDSDTDVEAGYEADGGTDYETDGETDYE